MKQVTLTKQMILQPEVKINTSEKLNILSVTFSSIDKGFDFRADLGKTIIVKSMKDMSIEQKSQYNDIEDRIKDLVTSFINV